MADGPILFFDGVCNLCHGAVQTVLRHDRDGRIRFASLQSDLAARLLPNHGIAPEALNSLVLLDGGRAYTESAAALRTAKLMGGPFRYLAHLGVLPRGPRDAVYRFIARNRYRVFGRKDECPLPRPEWKHRFVG